MRDICARSLIAPIGFWAVFQLGYLDATEILITTHSGNDVLCYDLQKGLLTHLVARKEGKLKQARGMTYGPSGDLFVCSAGSSNWAVLRYSPGGRFLGVFAMGGGLAHPYQCLFGPDGHLYVAGQDNNGVLQYDGKTGEYRGAFVEPGSGGLDGIRGIVFHPSGDLLVAGRDNNAVLRYEAVTGKPKGYFVQPRSGNLEHPVQLYYGADGHLYVGSSRNDRILRFDGKTGQFLDIFVKHKAGGLRRPAGFIWGPEGNFYVASRRSSQVLRYDGKTGEFLGVVISRRDDKRLHEPEFLLHRKGIQTQK